VLLCGENSTANSSEYEKKILKGFNKCKGKMRFPSIHDKSVNNTFIPAINGHQDPNLKCIALFKTPPKSLRNLKY
jgi:hypothetical protein